MREKMTKIYAKGNKNIILRVTPGHFVTPQSHITHYLDMTTMRSRVSEAQAVAKELANKYQVSTPVDTIVYMDSLEVIGAFLAEELTKAGVHSMNAHQTIYVTSPEFNSQGQILFRDNIQPMIKGKNCIILMSSVTTGKTLQSGIESILYYGGVIRGVSAIFSAVSKVAGVDVDSIFRQKDIPDYCTYKSRECKLCKNLVKIDALVNSFGYTKI